MWHNYSRGENVIMTSSILAFSDNACTQKHQGCTTPPNAAAPVKFATPPRRVLSRRCENLKSKILAKIKFYILTICNLSESFKKMELMRKDFSFYRRPFNCHDLTTYNALSYTYIIYNKYTNKYIQTHK